MVLEIVGYCSFERLMTKITARPLFCKKNSENYRSCLRKFEFPGISGLGFRTIGAKMQLNGGNNRTDATTER